MTTPARGAGSDPLELGARWITSPEHRRRPSALPVLAVVVDVPTGVVSAVLGIAVLGVLRATVDGRAVSADVLEPGYADWRREAEHTAWDVTGLLPPGRHVLRLDLAGGMYRSQREDDRWTKVVTDHGDIALAAALRLDLGRGEEVVVASGPDWRATGGATTRSGWFGGEDHDARLEPDASPDGVGAWPRAVLAEVPAGLRLVRRSTPPIRVVEELPAVAVERVHGAFVVDFGRNAAGWPVVDLPAGTEVRLRPAELLRDDGGVDVRTQGWGPVHHRVTTGDRSITWHPAFMYNGLRYLEVVGVDELPPSAARFQVLAAAADPAGDFRSGDERLESIWRITRNAVQSNMMSVFTDCPQREKLGYLEQVHLLHDLLVRTYRCGPVLDRMLDLAVGAQRDDGSIGLYAPEWERFPDPWQGDPNWGGAVVHLALARHRDTGDLAPVRSAYPAMRRYADFLLASRDGDGVLRDGLGDFNGASVQQFRHVPLVATASLHGLLRSTASAADLLDDDDGRDRLLHAAAEVADAFSRAFLRTGGTVGTDSIGETVFALDAGLLPAQALERLDDRIRADGYVLDVGEVAMALLVRLLADAGRHGTLLGITRVTEAPSYGYMLAHGATTLTETWDGPTFGFSQNHFMNGAIGSWFHEHLVGIRQRPGSVGWSRPVIAPTPVGDLSEVEGWYDSPRGRIVAGWRVQHGRFTVRGSTVPPAELRMPSGRRLQVVGDFEHTEPVPA